MCSGPKEIDTAREVVSVARRFLPQSFESSELLMPVFAQQGPEGVAGLQSMKALSFALSSGSCDGTAECELQPSCFLPALSHFCSL